MTQFGTFQRIINSWQSTVIAHFRLLAVSALAIALLGLIDPLAAAHCPQVIARLLAAAAFLAQMGLSGWVIQRLLVDRAMTPWTPARIIAFAGALAISCAGLIIAALALELPDISSKTTGLLLGLFVALLITVNWLIAPAFLANRGLGLREALQAARRSMVGNRWAVLGMVVCFNGLQGTLGEVLAPIARALVAQGWQPTQAVLGVGAARVFAAALLGPPFLVGVYRALDHTADDGM